jgi:hypothetical protein
MMHGRGDRGLFVGTENEISFNCAWANPIDNAQNSTDKADEAK